MLSFNIKAYSLGNNEPIALYGAKLRHFISPSIYWGKAGFGAIYGKRSGYLEGGIISGIYHKTSDFILDARLFAGAGGGGGAPQGGGFIINPSIGLGIPLTKQMDALIEYGYLWFVNGNIQSHTLECVINFHYLDYEVGLTDSPKLNRNEPKP